MTVLNLDSRRPPTPDVAICSCGSGWWTLRRPANTPWLGDGGAVCTDLDGRITGYAGDLVCLECGLPHPSIGPV